MSAVATSTDRTPPHVRAASPKRRAAAYGGGLTVRGAVVLVTAPTLLGAGFDAFVQHSLGWGFGLGLGLGGAWAAARLRPHERRAALVVPPLVYAAVVVATSIVQGAGGGMGERALDATVLLAERAPSLVTALVLAAAVMRWRDRQRG